LTKASATKQLNDLRRDVWRAMLAASVDPEYVAKYASEIVDYNADYIPYKTKTKAELEKMLVHAVARKLTHASTAKP